MPELPEAETIVRGLKDPIPGGRPTRIEIRFADLLEGEPDDWRDAIPRATFTGVTRRGKNVVLLRDDHSHLVVNLGMSGRLLWRPEGDPSPPPSHPAILISLVDGAGGPGVLVYHDPRRFGRLRLLSAPAYQAWSRTLGPEPLGPSFTAERFAKDLATSRSPIRSWLLDQRRIAGVGNIYASEACYRARIHPQTPANHLRTTESRLLHRALRSVLRSAVARGGTTLRDYRTAQGWEGAYQHALLAYGREGEPCPRCRHPISRIVFSARSAFLCSVCQPRV
jgi:formamidopyrimidine-DNA glycosylase